MELHARRSWFPGTRHGLLGEAWDGVMWVGTIQHLAAGDPSLGGRWQPRLLFDVLHWYSYSDEALWRREVISVMRNDMLVDVSNLYGRVERRVECCEYSYSELLWVE